MNRSIRLDSVPSLTPEDPSLSQVAGIRDMASRLDISERLDEKRQEDKKLLEGQVTAVSAI